MNARQLQEAIDKTRAWIMTQMDYKSTPSLDAKQHAVTTLAKLEEIQVIRAGMLTQPTLQHREKQND